MATAVVSPIFQAIVAPYPKFLCSIANEILSSGIHIKVGKAEFGIRAAARIVVVSCPSSSNNEGKNRGGRNAILAAFVPFKDRYTGNTPF